MPPKNDIFENWSVSWGTNDGRVIGKVNSVTTSTDGLTMDVTIDLDSVKKEEKMKYDLKNVTSISIERSDDDGTVTATAYGRDPYCPGHVAVIKRASAKCGPNDIYDFNIGAKLALDRLYEGYDMTPKPKRKPYNGKIFIAHTPGLVFSDSTLYEVKDGVIKYISGWAPCSVYNQQIVFCDMNGNDLSRELEKRLDYEKGDVSAFFVRHDFIPEI